MMKSRGFSFTQVSFSKKANEDISSLETGREYPKGNGIQYGLCQSADPKYDT